MRLLAECALLFISIAFVQGQPIFPQVNNLNAGISLPEVEQFLSSDKLQQLQNDIFATVVICLDNHCDVPTVAQALQQLVTQYVPQANQMPIDWEAVAQSALKNVAAALSNILSGATGGLFDKRDLDGNDLEFLGQLPIDKLAQIIQVVNIPDRATALDKLRQLLQQFFPAFQGRTNFDDLAENMLNNLNNLLPNLGQPPSYISG